MTSFFRSVAARWAALWTTVSVATLLWVPNVAHAETQCPSPARPFTAEQREAAQRGATDLGLLWRITKDGRTSWLYGTVHVGKPAWTFPGPVVLDALTQSDVLALEIDVTDTRLQGELQAAVALKPGRELPAPVRARLVAQMRQACLPEMLVNVVDPEMLGVMLTVVAGQRAGLDPNHGVDATLARVAKAGGQRVTSLESPESQLKALLSDTPRDMVASVNKMLSDLEKDRVVKPMMAMADAWAAGDAERLLAESNHSLVSLTRGQRAKMRELMEGRNPGLAAGIESLHASGEKVFAAVGSLHLVGADSVPALLARRGFDVQRVALTSR